MSTAEHNQVVNVTDMPVYQLFYQLALDIERKISDKGKGKPGVIVKEDKVEYVAASAVLSTINH
ncbi:MAG: hypothetical protein NTV49_13335 [Kiritimatiellaeota bacterium]|nr:hypothetical protein [Kiritimatiellota bacterium]